MTLVWKLLRQHISIPQLAGFFLANLFGMAIVLLGFQFYHDVASALTAEDSFMRSGFLVINKKIGTGSTLSTQANHFSDAEIDDIESQDFITALGTFTSAAYKADANMSVNGTSVLNNGEISFESIPNQFVEVPLKAWKYTPGSKEIPIILPKIYLTMYNFGFAQIHSLPKISEGLVGLVDFYIHIHANGYTDTYRGKVIGFSNRLSSILVPQAFMDWSNQRYAPHQSVAPTRLILTVKNPSDGHFTKYLDKKGYEQENDKLDAEKTTYFLRLLVTIVIIIGLVISALSFYILMLSIYLLLQKNSEKLENLLLIGYTPRQVAWPYRKLTLVLNFGVLLIAFVILFAVRCYYMSIMESLFPNLDDRGVWPTLLVGFVLFILVSTFNHIAIGRKVIHIWKYRN